MRDLGWTRVGVVFENSFYIETPGPWVCVTGSAAALGPLSLRCELSGSVDWRGWGIRRGMAAHVGETTIHLNPIFRLAFSGSSTWTPSPLPHWTPESLRRGIETVTSWTRVHLKTDEGLGCLILRDSERGSMSRVAERAIEPLIHLRLWLAAVVLEPGIPPEIPPVATDGLIGLGPGLTPSGDDFLGGTIIALHLLGCRPAARRLFETIGVKPEILSNPISASHLRAAAAGSCSAPIHAALGATLAGYIDSLPAKLSRIDRIGHTSGWDTMAGALTVLSAWSERNAIRL